MSASVPQTMLMKVLVIGASTGGPVALQKLLGALPSTFPVPILIVQHISDGFLAGMAQWLSQTTGFPVQVAKHREVPQPGHAYMAPEGRHMELDRLGRIALVEGIAENGLMPAISRLFQSAARVYHAGVLGILLTGMGEDGADGLLEIRNAGGYTIAECKTTAVIYGMPGAALARGGVCESLPLPTIAPRIMQLLHRKEKR